MPDLMEVAREAHQGPGFTACRETQAVAFEQVLLNTGLEGHGGGAHDALPGHGSATSVRLRLSSLA